MKILMGSSIWPYGLVSLVIHGGIAYPLLFGRSSQNLQTLSMQREPIKEISLIWEGYPAHTVADKEAMAPTLKPDLPIQRTPEPTEQYTEQKPAYKKKIRLKLPHPQSKTTQKNLEKAEQARRSQITAFPENAAPIYPEEAKKAGIQGTLKIRLFLNDVGSVQEAYCLTTAHPLLKEAALAAVCQWKFHVRLKRGETTTLDVPVRFVLERAKEIKLSS